MTVDSKGAAIDEIGHIIDDLISYEFNNPHYQPRTMVELRERAVVAILAILAQEVNKARIDELERLYDDWDDLDVYIAERKAGLV